jgi:hypothetical protein
VLSSSVTGVQTCALPISVTMGQHVIGGPVIGEAAVGLLFGTEPGPGIGSLI